MTRLTSVFVIDPPERLDPATDTSLAVMRESCRRGHRVLFTTLDGLRLSDSGVCLSARPVDFVPGKELFTAGSEEALNGAECDIVHMRKDPPVDMAYLHATLILDHLPLQVLQVNPSRSLRNHCEKLIPLELPGLLPPSLVTCSSVELSAFLERIGHIVIKPLGDCSGRGVVAVRQSHPERKILLEQATAGGSRFVQGQQFLPEVADGDKRVLMLGGEILAWVRRVPVPGEFRSNVNAGGRCIACELTESDQAICGRVGAWLRQRDIHLAGIDIVGKHVLEVNITSPSCLREINELTGRRLEERIVDYAELQSRQIANCGSARSG